MSTISIFYQNFHFWPRSPFFDQNFDFYQKLWFLTQIPIFAQNFDLWPKFRFVTKILIFRQYFDLRKKKIFWAQNFPSLPYTNTIWRKFSVTKNLVQKILTGTVWTPGADLSLIKLNKYFFVKLIIYLTLYLIRLSKTILYFIPLKYMFMFIETRVSTKWQIITNLGQALIRYCTVSGDNKIMVARSP